MIGSFIQGEKFDMLEGFGLVIESFIRIQKNLHPFEYGCKFLYARRLWKNNWKLYLR
jgi:hypothetical protein